MRKRIFEIIEVGDLSDKVSKCYDYAMMFLIGLSILPLCFKEVNSVFQTIDKITVTAFIIDYILRWITADFKAGKQGVVPFIKYPVTLFAIVDLLSRLPSLTVLNSVFKVLRIFRLNKAFKTLKFLRYSKSFNLIASVVKKQKRSLLAVCYLAGGYIFLSALIMFQVEPTSFENFFDAVYWAAVTLTTVGYGDIYPQTDVGRVVSMVSSFMGIAIVALPTGIITAGYMAELEKEEK